MIALYYLHRKPAWIIPDFKKVGFPAISILYMGLLVNLVCRQFLMLCSLSVVPGCMFRQSQFKFL